MRVGLRSGWMTGGLAALVFACSSGGSAPADTVGGLDPGAIPSVPSQEDPGVRVAVAPPPEATALRDEADRARGVSVDDLRAAHAVTFGAGLGYDPLAAANLDQFFLRLDFRDPVAFRAELQKSGFAMESEGRYASFVGGYSDIYSADLPVFISSDMVLEAIYRSHDKILQALEQASLHPKLDHLLTTVRAALSEQASSFEPDVASDLNVYLGVAISLLHDGFVEPGEPAEVKDLVSLAMSASGTRARVLFGVERELDFSQFKPRGHYAGDKGLEAYFRAMIWLGRTDLRLIETTSSGEQVLRRRQVESMLALRKLVGEAALAEYRAIDAAIGAFVGEHDYMTLDQVDELLAKLNAPGGVAAVSDEALASAIVAGQFGQQRIASQVMRRYPGAGPLPLSASFALFGQRYTVDSHVFSNVVYDRVPTRVLPDPLDAAFAAMGNDQALGLLGSALDDEAEYAGQLSAMRTLVDAHPQAYWQSSLYTSWLGALRTLSPTKAPAADLPAVARSDAWGRRLLNTQLGSWAQLRHNNVLYVKQSYTSGAACEYPDAYVDPYPDFFDAIVTFAERAQELTQALEVPGELGERVQKYFADVARINGILAAMARAQRSGAPHSPEHLAFINQTVQAFVGCDGAALGQTGWYSELHFDPLQAVEADPSITDVHTDVGGDFPVPRDASVLHVGTALPRLMIVTVDSCSGPRAYAGVVSSYQQFFEPGLDRLTDEEWKQRLYSRHVPAVPWLEPLLVK
jgi:Protein of unknown function (DUF3160)